MPIQGCLLFCCFAQTLLYFSKYIIRSRSYARRHEVMMPKSTRSTDLSSRSKVCMCCGPVDSLVRKVRPCCSFRRSVMEETIWRWRGRDFRLHSIVGLHAHDVADRKSTMWYEFALPSKVSPRVGVVLFRSMSNRRRRFRVTEKRVTQ